MSLQSDPSLSQGISDTFTTRYLTVAGAVMLLYDHLLTAADEYQYIWKAVHSITKYSFLSNRYLVLVVMLVTLHEMCGFNGYSYSDRGCKLLLVISIGAATLSSITANFLILHRFLELWKDSKRTRIFLRCVHATSACIHISLTVIVIMKSWAHSNWSPIVNMCTTSVTLTLFPVLWGAPLIFEFSTIILVVYNTLATPRSSTVPFRRTLQKNGIIFFSFVIFVRLVAVGVSATARKSIAVSGLYFLWTATTMFFNHSFIRLREAEVKQQQLSMSCHERTLPTVEFLHTARSSTNCPSLEVSTDAYRLRLIRPAHL